MNLNEIRKKLLEEKYYTSAMTQEETVAWQVGVQDMFNAVKNDFSWANPYSEAIALLERAARGHEGSYG